MTGALFAEIPAGTKPHGIAFEPTGDRVFVTDEDDGLVLVFGAKTREQLASFASAMNATGFCG